MSTDANDKKNDNVAVAAAVVVNNTSPPPPSYFVCPFTPHQVMEDPVMDLCAHNFERHSIVKWLQSNHKYCPISRKPLHETDLVPNHTLAERIEKYKFLQQQQQNHHVVWNEEQHQTSQYLSSDDELELDNFDVAIAAVVRDDDEDNNKSNNPIITTDDDDDDDDVERQQQRRPTGRRRRLPRLSRQRRRRSSKYAASTTSQQQRQQLPAEFMLLPQERHVLQIVRIRAQQHRHERRKRLVLCSVLGVLVAALVIGFGLWMVAKKLMWLQDNEEEEEKFMDDEQY